MCVCVCVCVVCVGGWPCECAGMSPRVCTNNGCRSVTITGRVWMCVGVHVCACGRELYASVSVIVDVCCACAAVSGQVCEGVCVCAWCVWVGM